MKKIKVFAWREWHDAEYFPESGAVYFNGVQVTLADFERYLMVV